MELSPLGKRAGQSFGSMLRLSRGSVREVASSGEVAGLSAMGEVFVEALSFSLPFPLQVLRPPPMSMTWIGGLKGCRGACSGSRARAVSKR